MFCLFGKVFANQVTVQQTTYFNTNGTILQNIASECENTAQWFKFQLHAPDANQWSTRITAVKISLKWNTDILSFITITDTNGTVYGIGWTDSNTVTIPVAGLLIDSQSTKDIYVTVGNSCKKWSVGVEVIELQWPDVTETKILDSYSPTYTPVVKNNITENINDLTINSVNFDDSQWIAKVELCVSNSSSELFVPIHLVILNKTTTKSQSFTNMFQSDQNVKCATFDFTYGEWWIQPWVNNEIIMWVNQIWNPTLSEWNTKNNIFTKSYTPAKNLQVQSAILERMQFPTFSEQSPQFQLCNLSKRIALSWWTIPLKIYNLTVDPEKKNPFVTTINHNSSLDVDNCFYVPVSRDALKIKSATTYKVEAELDVSSFISPVEIRNWKQNVVVTETLEQILERFFDIYIESYFVSSNAYEFNVCNRGGVLFKWNIDLKLYADDLFTTNINDIYHKNVWLLANKNECKKYLIPFDEVPNRAYYATSKQLRFLVSVASDNIAYEYTNENNTIVFDWKSFFESIGLKQNLCNTMSCNAFEEKTKKIIEKLDADIKKQLKEYLVTYRKKLVKYESEITIILVLLQ